MKIKPQGSHNFLVSHEQANQVILLFIHGPILLPPPNFESQLKSHIWQKKHNSVFNIFLHQDLATSSTSRKEDFVKFVQLHGLTRSSSFQIWEQNRGESKWGGWRCRQNTLYINIANTLYIKIAMKILLQLALRAICSSSLTIGIQIKQWCTWIHSERESW